jgi:putative Mn2+ efflux pump MntP
VSSAVLDHLLSAILLAVSANLDNLGVGLAYGMSGRGFRLAHAWLIALVSGAGTLVSMAAGEWLNDFTTEACANLIGSLLLVAIGLQAIVHAVRSEASGAARVERNATTSREAAVLAVSLSVNNLGSGLGAGISHVSVPVTTALTIAGSMAAIVGGCRLGAHAASGISKRALGVTAGLLVTAVGIYELFV